MLYLSPPSTIVAIRLLLTTGLLQHEVIGYNYQSNGSLTVGIKLG